MAPVALLLLQAGSAVTTQPDDRLLHLAPASASACRRSTTDIVVCGKDSGTYRLPKPDPRYDVAGPPKAEWGLGGDTKMSMHAAPRSAAGGIPLPPAAMVTITIPF